jgi:outer membrane autotransporter protein
MGDGLFYRANPHNADIQDGRSDTAGTLAGIDGKIGGRAVIGALFAYDNAAVTLGGDGSHATIESYTGGLYGAWHQDGFYANSLAAYTRNHYSSQRDIAIPGFPGAASGSTNGNQYTANLDGGYDWHVTSHITAGPLAGVQYVHLDVNGFNDSGAGAADLGIGSQVMNSLQSRVGGRVDFHLATTASSSFAAELYAAWQHEYLDGSRAIGAGFEGAGLAPFSVQTSSPLRDAAVAGASLNFTFHNRLTLYADCELQLWQASYFEQTINAGARISF